ncbi:MAG: hypothetical protein QOE32_884, partial [Pseudonocardiales bacterium]|nr:hypothetical protein [Pseudonocardiales bacterium]
VDQGYPRLHAWGLRRSVNADAVTTG